MASDTVATPLARAGGKFPGGATGSRGGDSNHESSWIGVPDRVYVTGLLVALSGIGMFFVALASAYVVRRGLAQNDWRFFAVPRILWLNSSILLASSATLGLSAARRKRNDLAGFKHWWFVSAILGLLFLAGQLIAWRQLASAGVYLASDPHAGFFYIFTAAHGVHLIVGLAALLVLSFRAPRRMAFDTATRVAGLYWHFLAGLWMLLLLFLVIER